MQQQENRGIITRLGGRISGMFRRNRETDIPHVSDMRDGAGNGEAETSTSFIRPTPRRNSMNELNEGMASLANLMTAIRDSLEQQSERQAHLLGYLAHLPEAINRLPESFDASAQSLHAIQQHLEAQGLHQQQLADILSQIRDGGSVQAEALEALRFRVEALGSHDAAISHSLTAVGSSMEQFNLTAAATSNVLGSMQENMATRDGELERIVTRQNTRFTTLLSVAIFMSVASLTAVAVIGYLLLNK